MYGFFFVPSKISFTKKEGKHTENVHNEHTQKYKTLPKAHRTRGLSSSYQSYFLRSYHKFKHKYWIKIKIRISTKHQLLRKTSASPINLKSKILTKPSFRISTKIQLHHLYKTSAAKCWTSFSFKVLLNFNFKILTNPCAQSLKKFSFRTKRQLPNL